MNELIQWPRAKYWTRAWNPVVGCRAVSPACDHCWAREWARRFGKRFEPHNVGRRKVHWGLEYHVTKPCPSKGVVFAGNMTDLWGEWVHYPEHYVTRGVDAGETATAVLWLTKRTENLERFFRLFGPMQDYARKGWMENQFFGFTAENQEWYENRFRDFRRIPTKFKGWLSAEPLLGPIDLGLQHVSTPEAMPFQWVVVGCESGRNRRPCKVEWVEGIVEECMGAGVPVFVKQLDLGGRVVTDIERFPENLRVRQVPWAGDR